MIELSVVVPVRNEAQRLPALLDALAAQRGIALEVIVADGRSTDTSRRIAAARGVVVTACAPGRGAQMNAGAKLARGHWILFLHADSLPQNPHQLADAVQTLRAAPDHRAAGHFALHFVRRRRGHGFLYRYLEAKSASGRPQTINGDQGLLLTRAWFWELGGFDTSLGFLEDQRLAARIRSQGRWLLLPGRLATSARRFEAEGPIERTLLMAVIMTMEAIDLRSFFARAPALYRHQEAAEALLLTPYFRLLRALMRESGLRKSCQHWLRVGRYAAGESWQLFFALDVLLQPLWGRRQPATTCHDRVIAALMRNRVAAGAAAALVFAVSMGLLAPTYRWRERKALARIAAAPAGQ